MRRLATLAVTLAAIVGLNAAPASAHREDRGWTEYALMNSNAFGQCGKGATWVCSRVRYAVCRAEGAHGWDCIVGWNERRIWSDPFGRTCRAHLVIIHNALYDTYARDCW